MLPTQTALLPRQFAGKSHRVMLFVDGENLAIRYSEELGTGDQESHVSYRQDVCVWSHLLTSYLQHNQVIRKHYYTSIVGDDDEILAVENELRELGIERPRVFKRSKGRQSKRVDIALVTGAVATFASKQFRYRDHRKRRRRLCAGTGSRSFARQGGRSLGFQERLEPGVEARCRLHA